MSTGVCALINVGWLSVPCLVIGFQGLFRCSFALGWVWVSGAKVGCVRIL